MFFFFFLFSSARGPGGAGLVVVVRRAEVVEERVCKERRALARPSEGAPRQPSRQVLITVKFTLKTRGGAAAAKSAEAAGFKSGTGEKYCIMRLPIKPCDI